MPSLAVLGTRRCPKPRQDRCQHLAYFGCKYFHLLQIRRRRQLKTIGDEKLRLQFRTGTLGNGKELPVLLSRTSSISLRNVARDGNAGSPNLLGDAVDLFAWELPRKPIHFHAEIHSTLPDYGLTAESG